MGNDPLSYTDPLGLAWQLGLSYTGTLIVPGGGITVGLNAGISFDWGDTRVFGQAQSAYGPSTGGVFVGWGPGIVGGHGETPSTGFDQTPYIEADVALGVGAGGSATKDKCGRIDWSLTKGIKLSEGAGVGGFTGVNHTATIASPTFGDLFWIDGIFQ